MSYADDGRWAQLQTGDGADGDVHKMVMNIGYRPTCDDGAGLTVEIHVMHGYKDDFHGEPLRAVALGYIRQVGCHRPLLMYYL